MAFKDVIQQFSIKQLRPYVNISHQYMLDSSFNVFYRKHSLEFLVGKSEISNADPQYDAVRCAAVTARITAKWVR